MGTMRDEDVEVIREGRNGSLGEMATSLDGKEVEIKAPLREQVVDKLYKTLVEQKQGQKTLDLWNIGNSERSEWLSRQQALLQTFDEFVNPIYEATSDWSSTLHLPTVYTACKTMHARFLAALLGVDPPFTVKARQAHNVDRADLIQELMRYMFSTAMNENKGVEKQVDQWLWEWITSGSAILKGRWHRRFVQFVDVIEEDLVVGATMVPSPDGSGQLIPQPVYERFEREEEVTQEVFNGPMLESVPIEDVLIIGGNGDPQAADDVIQSSYMTASELWSLADQGIFKAEVVEKVVRSGEDLQLVEQVNQIKAQMAASSGTGQIDSSVDQRRYQILERYARIDVKGNGIASEIILWVHGATGEILRATYLHRVNKAGLRPYFKADYHLRKGQDYGVGLPELMYSVAREIDALHNMRLDFGLISSMPFGYYRPTSSIKDERVPLEPGALIPLDNPQTDVFFPQIGNRTGFLLQEEQMLYQTQERMTSISDLSLGVIGGQGAARTATGARALLGESNANLDVYLRRMNRGWQSAVQYTFKLLQDRLPDGFQFRLLGDNGSDFWKTIRTKGEISGEYDFLVEANSANSNKAVSIEQANNVFATVMNPLLIQLQVVTPIEIYNALRDKLKIEGVRDFSRYIRKPQGSTQIYEPIQVANAILAGIDVKLGPEQDLAGFITWFEKVLADDNVLGYFSESQTVALARKAQEASAMLEAVQMQMAQQANQQQMAINAGGASAPNPQGAGASASQMTQGGGNDGV